MRQMSLTDAVVAMRFHNVVCAIMLCKPVIAIDFSRKADQMLAEVGMREFRQTLEQLDVDVLYAQVQKLLGDRGPDTRKGTSGLRPSQSSPSARRLDEQEGILIRKCLLGTSKR